MGETFHCDTNLWGHEGGIPTLVNLVCRIPQSQPQATTSETTAKISHHQVGTLSNVLQ